MSLVHIGRVTAAVAVVFGMTALAQASGQQSQPQSERSQGTAAAEKITITGCVVTESDYRKSHDAGRGGVVGTGIGAGNEYVVTGATMSGANAGNAGNAGAAGPGVAYELTGKNEGMAAQHVGRRVEISGTLKAAEMNASGTPTGGPSAGRPPSGVDVVSKDLKIREIEVESIREVGTTCPAV
jgi:hypothetical protein